MGWPSKDPARYYDPERDRRFKFPLWRGSDRIIWTPLSIGLRAVGGTAMLVGVGIAEGLAFAGGFVLVALAYVLESRAKRRDGQEARWLMRPFWTRRDRYHQLPWLERWGLTALAIVSVPVGFSIDDDSWIPIAVSVALLVGGLAFQEWHLRRIRSKQP